MANPEIDNHIQSEEQKEIQKLKNRIEELEHRESSYSEGYDRGEEYVREEYDDIITIVDNPYENIKSLKEYIIKLFRNGGDTFELEEFTRLWIEEMKLRNIIK